jgi:hypothetical protein
MNFLLYCGSCSRKGRESMNRQHCKSVIDIRILALLCGLIFQHNLRAAGTVSICDEAHLRTALVGGGLVTFASDGTIPLAGTLIITNATTINAAGHVVTLSGNNAVRVFTINAGKNLSLFNLTIAHGLAAGTNGTAGGIGQGGAVQSTGGTLVASNCQFLANSAVGGNGTNGAGGAAFGGAVCVNNGSLFTTNCQFAGNISSAGNGSDIGTGLGGEGFGGAIESSNGVVVMVNCTFATNQVHGGIAGAVYIGPFYFSSTSGAAHGGAICAAGGFSTNINCQFTGNAGFTPDSPNLGWTHALTGSPVQGGAIFNGTGILKIIGCTFTSNHVTGGSAAYINGLPGSGYGGAIFNGGQLQLSNCVLNLNVALGGRNGSRGGDGEGGALFNGGSAVAASSWFSSNTVRGALGYSDSFQAGSSPSGLGKGGAISSTNSLVLLGCTLSDNEAEGLDGGDYGSYIGAWGPSEGFGGAIYNTGSCRMTNNTLAANQAVSGSTNSTFFAAGGGNAYGGAIANNNGTLVSMNNTFALNNAVFGIGTTNGVAYGGGIFTTNGGVTLMNTLLTNGTFGDNFFGTLVDAGYNLSSDASCNFSAPGGNMIDPKLGPLADYGGPTPTMALLSGSPAIDGGSLSTFPATDQRGRARPFGVASDVGAFESSAPYSILGTITGPAAQYPMNVVAGTTNGPLINGSYAIHGLSASTYVVTPNTANYFFLPVNQMITVGPDQVGVDFNSYNWQTLILEEITNSSAHLIFCVSNAPTFRVFASVDLQQWSPISTNSVGTSNYSSLFIPIGNEPAQFFRAISP